MSNACLLERQPSRNIVAADGERYLVTDVAVVVVGHVAVYTKKIDWNLTFLPLNIKPKVFKFSSYYFYKIIVQTLLCLEKCGYPTYKPLQLCQ